MIKTSSEHLYKTFNYGIVELTTDFGLRHRTDVVLYPYINFSINNVIVTF